MWDFIEFCNSKEKLGGALRSNILMDNFNSALLDFDFHDVSFSGPIFHLAQR